MKAFTNTIETKEQAVAAVMKHREQDMLIKGTYGEGSGDKFKGCSVGCTYAPFRKSENENIHKLSEKVHGIPQDVTMMRDRIFEGLPAKTDRDNWHVDFTLSINVGADLSLVIPKLMYWLMTDPEGILKHADKATKVIIAKVAELFNKKIHGVKSERSECLLIYKESQDNRYKTDDAVAAYAAASADAAAAYAAAYAAEAAASAEAAAAYAYAYTAYAAYADAGRGKYFIRIAAALIVILKETT